MNPSAASLCIIVAYVFHPKDATSCNSWKFSVWSGPLPSSLPLKAFPIPSNKNRERMTHSISEHWLENMALSWVAASVSSAKDQDHMLSRNSEGFLARAYTQESR